MFARNSRSIVLLLALLASLPIAGAIARHPDDPETLMFTGSYAAGPKTTRLITDTIEEFTKVKALRATLSPDADMLAKYPDIVQPHNDTFNVRVDEEKRLVRVTCKIYAYKSESDNDFHLICGDARSPGKLLNVEVSGLPNTADKAALQAVRHDFISIKNNHPHSTFHSYQKFDNPVPVRIVGAIYFDADHSAGEIGPTGLKPSTIWEIHPVQAIGEP